MTPEEIRAVVTERLARAEYMKDREIIPDMLGMATPPPVWEDASDAARQEHRRFVGHLVDALGDLIPTSAETRTIVHDPDPDPEDTDYVALYANGVMGEYSDIAERWRDEGGRVVNQRRWTHGWQEVPE